MLGQSTVTMFDGFPGDCRDVDDVVICFIYGPCVPTALLQCMVHKTSPLLNCIALMYIVFLRYTAMVTCICYKNKFFTAKKANEIRVYML